MQKSEITSTNKNTNTEIVPKLNDPLWEKYVEYEDLETGNKNKGGGGSKRVRNPHSKTSQAARNETIKNSQEKRQGEARDRIVKIINEFPKFISTEQEDKFINEYSSWVKQTFTQGLISFENDLKFDYVRSGAKAGGQNLNKVSSAVVCTHVPTNINVRNEETRDQFRNKQKAISLMKKSLGTHMEDWKTLVKDPKEITSDLVLNLSAETN
jgi:hypothetical protein